MFTRLFAAVTLLVALIVGADSAHAQCANTYTKFSLDTQITSDFPTQTTGYVSPSLISTFLDNAVASWSQIATVNAQAGTSYTVVGDTSGLSDNGKLISFTNSSAVAVTLPAASASGFCPFAVYFKNNSSGATVTVTPQSGTIGGSGTLALGVGAGAFVVSDGTNWQLLFAGGGGSGGTPGGSNTQLQYNSGGSFGGIVGVASNGTMVTFNSGTLVLNGATSGTTTLNASAVASGTLTLPAATDTLTANAAAQTLTNKTITGPTLTGTVAGNPTLSGNPTFSGTANFSGVFQIGGSTQTFPGSGVLVGAGDTQTLTNKSIAGSEINSGTVSATYLPTATSGAKGVVQTDGSTISVSSGTISCTTGTTSQLGCLEPDGSTITVSNGVITSTAAGSAAAITIGTTTITSGSTGKVLYQNGASPGGTIGEYTITGTGNVVMSASPTLSGTVGGNLTFGGNLTLSGTLTAASLATPGSIAGSICSSSGGAIYYVPGANCYGGAVLSLNSLTGLLSITAGNGISVTPSNPNIQVTCSNGTTGAVGCLQVGNGLAVSSGTVSLALTNATLQASLGSPTGCSTGCRTTTYVMMGLGGTATVTPVYSGRVLVQFFGNLTNNSGTGIANTEMLYGTGTAPSNGTAQTGTRVGPSVGNSTGTQGAVPFSVGGIITGLSTGTAYWFDLALNANTAGTSTVGGVYASIMEF